MKRVSIFQLASSALFKGDTHKSLEVLSSKVHQPNTPIYQLPQQPAAPQQLATPQQDSKTSGESNNNEFDHVCNTCIMRFNDRELRNQHYRSALHRYNIKLKLASMTPVTSEEFSAMMEAAAAQAADSSSDDSSDYDSSDDDNTNDSVGDEEKLLKRIARDVDKIDISDPTMQNYLFTSANDAYTPKLSFIHKELKLEFTIWRAILQDSTTHQEDVQLAQFKAICTETTGKWAILLCSGGRFSGAVYQLVAGGQAPKAIEHKTLHRYTVRKGQGGSQAKKDQEGGVAGSAGSFLRRYNEKRLREEVIGIMRGWNAHLKECKKIYIFAPKGNTRDILLPPDNSGPIPTNDPRIQVVPFPIIRPTFAENQRVSNWLYSVDIGLFEEVPLTPITPQQESQDTITTTTTTTAEPEKPVEPTEVVHSEYEKDPLFEATRNKDLDKVIHLLEEDDQYELPIPTQSDSLMTPLFIAVQKKDFKMVEYLVRALPDDIDVCIPSWHFRTALHRAAADGSLEIVKLLMDNGADPTVEGFRKETVYEVASNQARDLLREWAGDHLDEWDYLKARIPPLTKEMLVEREENKKKKKKNQKEKEKAKKAAERQAKLDEQQRAVEEEKAKQAKLAELKLLESVKAERQAKDSLLTDRERRALAAEARLGGYSGPVKKCTQCFTNILSTPFERLSFTYCSTACVLAHKKQLESTLDKPIKK
ncbi:hypothetical protein PPL_11154 [Heterostelium album PN500]|uniref:VLRF1 domain-containing protein n=1 Tax=Heterostelium pallidum (strain ATCC 26659 / Pp 5 / PN500) TaxID=670386 RepID=D3BTP4_HETP5|nr:hypothetical protein PPL_11154 [Heterostelium album PN500]EFA75080.1 hypothetical protein PPL_11154 [Heterostelium album PN500]|eukprot:XP_020427214.1 hypothetical protein PPL_11154 [Heterostelium album PN500]